MSEREPCAYTQNTRRQDCRGRAESLIEYSLSIRRIARDIDRRRFLADYRPLHIGCVRIEDVEDVEKQAEPIPLVEGESFFEPRIENKKVRHIRGSSRRERDVNCPYIQTCYGV